MYYECQIKFLTSNVSLWCVFSAIQGTPTSKIAPKSLESRLIDCARVRKNSIFIILLTLIVCFKNPAQMTLVFENYAHFSKFFQHYYATKR